MHIIYKNSLYISYYEWKKFQVLCFKTVIHSGCFLLFLPIALASSMIIRYLLRKREEATGSASSNTYFPASIRMLEVRDGVT